MLLTPGGGASVYDDLGFEDEIYGLGVRLFQPLFVFIGDKPERRLASQHIQDELHNIRHGIVIEGHVGGVASGIGIVIGPAAGRVLGGKQVVQAAIEALQKALLTGRLIQSGQKTHGVDGSVPTGTPSFDFTRGGARSGHILRGKRQNRPGLVAKPSSVR